MKSALNRRRLLIVALSALLLRCLFIIWGWTGFYTLEPTTLTETYVAEAYGICAGYGYINPDYSLDLL